MIKGDTVDFDIMDGMLSEMSPVYDKESIFIINPLSLMTKKQKKDHSLANLLETLRESKATGLSGKISKKKKKYKSQLNQEEYKLQAGMGWKKTKKKISPLRAQLWNRMKMSQSNTQSGEVNYGQIMKVIDKHNFQFQECYERALLKDETLSGKVIFLLKLTRSHVKKSGLELQGKGNPSSRRELTRCLFTESKKMIFSNNKGNISIKFNLIFGL